MEYSIQEFIFVMFRGTYVLENKLCLKVVDVTQVYSTTLAMLMLQYT